VKKAKLFMNGRSQAVRLPKEYRMPGSEVFVERRGDEIVLRPIRTASEGITACKTLGDLARYFRDHGPVSEEFETAIREARERDRKTPPRTFGW